jgi:hypothetical protein
VERLNVFLSVGRTFNDRQESLAQAVERFLKTQEMTPQTVGRTYFSSKQPLVAITELMHDCAGTVVLAFERTHSPELYDKRGSSQEQRQENVSLPTVWNQIEAAIAYTLEHPLLVIVENGLKYEGLLEKGYDWYVKGIDLDDDLMADREFLGVFADWKRRVESYHQQKVKKSLYTSPMEEGIAPRELLIRLRRILTDRFDEGELEVLCYDLNIPYEELPGDKMSVKAMRLIRKLEQTNRIDELIGLGKGMRPDISWPTF